MIHKGAIALTAVAAFGLAVGFFGVTWLSSPGAGTRPVAAAMPDEVSGDAIDCQTGQPVENAALDIVAVSVTSKPGGYEVHVRTALPATEVFANAFSAAVLVTLGNQTGIAQIHAETETRGLEDDLTNIIPGTEDNVSIESDGVHINFPGDLKVGAELLVETFHQKSFLDDVTCDTAFSDDPTAPKPTPTPSATATPTPTATPGLATDTPTPTATPELFKVDVIKVHEISHNQHPTLAGWEMKIFAGDVCLGSPIASGLTTGPPGGVPTFSVFLPAGDYSAAETQVPGWERVSGPFCQDFTVGPDEFMVVTFTNRKIRNGDVTGDGVADSRDASVVLQYTAGLTIQEEIADFVRGDVNMDDSTDAIDATLILQNVAGFYDFNCAPECGYFSCVPDCGVYSCDPAVPDCVDSSCDPGVPDCVDSSCDPGVPDCGDFSCEPGVPDCGDTNTRLHTALPVSERPSVTRTGIHV